MLRFLITLTLARRGVQLQNSNLWKNYDGNGIFLFRKSVQKDTTLL